MDEIRDWFEECPRVFSGLGHDFVIYNGFKLTHYLDDNSYTIQDTRKNDFYTDVTDEDLKIIRRYGFINGTGVISHFRNIARVGDCILKIKELFEKKALAKKMLSTDRKFFSKQIRNCDVNIHNYNDLLHFYKSKVKQFESKYLNLIKNN